MKRSLSLLQSGGPASAGPSGPLVSPGWTTLRLAGPLLFSLVVISVLAGCTDAANSDDLAIDPVPTATTHDVEIELFQYQPETIEIQAGDSVTWTNADAIEHSATFETAEMDIDTGLFQQDESMTLTLPDAGT